MGDDRESPPLPAGYSLRDHHPDDDPLLVGIENRAAAMFRAHGYPQIADNPFPDVAAFRAMSTGHRVWVAASAAGPAGYAVAAPLGRFFHLRELSVHPSHGRKGLGTALVRAVVEAGRIAGLDGTSLTTFRSVPFNMPFYAGLGFEELPLDRAPDVLRDAFFRELGEIVPAERVLMVLRF